jgi:poly-beta-1,6-N-acetyl-D-glucosamine synthase
VDAWTPIGGGPLSPRGKHARQPFQSAGDQVELRPLPEQCHGEPDLAPSTRTRLGQIANEPQRRSPARHRRETPGTDVLRARSAPTQDQTKTAPIPRPTYEAATGGVTGHTQAAGLEALLSISALVQDVPATVELPRRGKSATDGAERRYLAPNEARAGDMLIAPSMRRSAAAVAFTRSMPGVRPPRSPAQRGPASYREPRRQVTSRRHRSPVPVRGGFEPRTARVVALIPAHNEEASIAATIRSLLAQTRPPDRIVVMCDRCTDDTAAIAARFGVSVMRTAGNTGRKAGALNQALDAILPGMHDTDAVLIQDADSFLVPEFTVAASSRLSKKTGAVGGVFYGAPGGGILGFFQRSEFVRYARDIARNRHQVFVLSGTAALFLVSTLRDVRRARNDGRLPSGQGGVYDEQAFTEDNELTLALKTLGYRPESPPACRVVTEVMPTVSKLWHQRVRWQRGAVENLRTYGWTKATRGYIIRQLGMAGSVAALALFLLVTCVSVLASHHFGVSAPWAMVGVLFVAERVVTVRRAGWLAMLVASVLVIELLYDLFQHAVYVRCIAGAVRNGKQRWAAT